MKLIGATSVGTVIIEMSASQFANLAQDAEAQPTPPEVKKAAQPVMALKRRLNSVRTCLDKLRPRNRFDLIRTIESVHKSTGGIGVREVEQMVMVLEREDFLSIDEEGIVKYLQQATG